jgi:excisionase family DNA binding protein
VEKLLYSIVPDAVSMTGLSRSTLYAEISRGRLRVVKCGRRTLVPADALFDYVELLTSETAGSDASTPEVAP